MGKASLGIRWAGNIAELEKPESSSRCGRRGDFFASELPVTPLKASKILTDRSLYCDCNRQFLVEVSFFSYRKRNWKGKLHEFTRDIPRMTKVTLLDGYYPSLSSS